jgi:hypothetical protein
MLGYSEWRNFTAVIEKAMTACEVSGHPPSDHFVDVNKTIKMPKGAEKEVPDVMLTLAISQKASGRAPQGVIARSREFCPPWIIHVRPLVFAS